jgi:subtilisin family serine protease
MNLKISIKKFTAYFLSGILVPSFLLVPFIFSPQTVQATGETVKIIYALKDGELLNGYGLTEQKFLFGGNGLPMTYKATASTSDFALMRNDSRLVYVEVDSPVHASEITVTSEIVTNDPYFTNDDMDEDKQWYLDKIKLPQAWEYGRGSSSVKVAIIDTGIHSSHLDLNDGRILAGFDITTGKAIPAEANSDDNGHGTAVTGVIGAISNNGKGIAGINWQIGIIPVKALSADGSGTISDIASGIVWASENGAHIINLSLGGSGFGDDQTLNNSIIYAYNKGATIVSAAGNDLADHGISLDSNPVYPICADGGNNMIIGVAATDVNDQKASFSNYGVSCVDISAPGKKILTTAFLPSDPSNNVLIYGSGTSLAAPIVSGVAALLKANNQSLTNTEIKNIILRTSDNIDSLNQKSCLGSSCNGYLGKGRINALSALSPQPLLDGTLVREKSTGIIYLISGGKKRAVSDFIFQQRGYALSQVIDESNNQLSNYQIGLPLPPQEGTLIKSAGNPTVYFIHQDVKRPLTYLVFQSRNFRFSDVVTIPDQEVIAIPTGEWYWPPDGTMVLVKKDPTVYVMDSGVKRPVTYFVFNQRRLSFARVVEVTQDEFTHIPKAPDSYWLPPVEGTLVKSAIGETVFLIKDGSRQPITYEAFIKRNLKFSDIKTLPQAEIDVILLGLPVLN